MVFVSAHIDGAADDPVEIRAALVVCQRVAVGVERKGIVARVDGGAARHQRDGQGRSAVVLQTQWVEQRIAGEITVRVAGSCPYSARAITDQGVADVGSA